MENIALIVVNDKQFMLVFVLVLFRLLFLADGVRDYYVFYSFFLFYSKLKERGYNNWLIFFFFVFPPTLFLHDDAFSLTPFQWFGLQD